MHFPENCQGLIGNLSDVAGRILQKVVSENDWSELKAFTIYEIIHTLFAKEGGHNYKNFYSKCVHSMSSSFVNKLLEKRTLQDKLRTCLPLEQYLTKELAASQIEIVLEGLFFPTNSDIARTSEQAQAANGMVRTLIEAGLDFEHLHEIFQLKGLESLELALRTAFVHKLAGQSRHVVDQVNEYW